MPLFYFPKMHILRRISLIKDLYRRRRAEVRIGPGAQRPDNFLVWRHLDCLHRSGGLIDRAVPLVHPVVDQRVAVRKALGPRNEPGKEVFGIGRGIAPERHVRAIRAACRANVIAVLVGRRHEFVDRGIFIRLAAGAVVENEQVPGAAQSLRNPLDVVLKEKALIEIRPLEVGSRSATTLEA